MIDLLQIWVEKIKEYYFNDELLSNLSNNGINTINSEFNLSKFDTNLENIIYE